MVTLSACPFAEIQRVKTDFFGIDAKKSAKFFVETAQKFTIEKKITIKCKKVNFFFDNFYFSQEQKGVLEMKINPHLLDKYPYL